MAQNNSPTAGLTGGINQVVGILATDYVLDILLVLLVVLIATWPVKKAKK